MMINITKKYFGTTIRIEKIDTEKWLWSACIGGNIVKGLHVYIGKIYFSFYMRFWKRTKNE